jgi:hypothetical protein
MAGAFLLVGSGCSGSGKGYFPAVGQILVDGKPAEGVQVTLVPVNGPEDSGRKPSGLVGADGRFTLTTYEAGTRKVHGGAPAGQYVVLLSWAPQPTRESLQRGVPDPDRLDRRYQDPKTSPLRAEVKEASTELPPIQLARSDLKDRRR